MILRVRFVQSFTDRHGRGRFYLRRRGHKAVPLPSPDEPGFLAAYQAALAATAPPKPCRVLPGSLEDLARSYLISPSFLALGASTAAVYRRILAAVLREHGEKPARLLGTIHVRRIIHARATTPAAANHILRTMRALMRHAIDLEWRADDPTRDVRRLKEKGEGAATWTEADIAAFESRWAPGTKPRLALALLLYTGQRRSDVVRMGRQHVKDGAIEVRQVKTGVRLLIPLHPRLAALLATETDRLTYLTTEAGAAFSPNGFYMRFRGWCKAAKLPAGRSPHGLRKAAARRLAEAGCTAHEIAAVTGHRTLAEVQRYTQAVDQARLAVAAVARIGTVSGTRSVKSRRRDAQTGK